MYFASLKPAASRFISSFLLLNILTFSTEVEGLINLSPDLDPVPANSTCLNEYSDQLINTSLTDFLNRNCNFNPQIVVNPDENEQMIAVFLQDQWRSNQSGTDITTARTKNGGKHWIDSIVPLQICLPGPFAISDRFFNPDGAWSRDGSTFYLLGQFTDGFAFLLPPFQPPAPLPPSVFDNGLFVITSKTGGASWRTINTINSQLNSGPVFIFSSDIAADPRISRKAYVTYNLQDGPFTTAFFSETDTFGEHWTTPTLCYDITQDPSIFPDALFPLFGGSLFHKLAVLPRREFSGKKIINAFTRFYPDLNTGVNINDICVLVSSDEGHTWPLRANQVSTYIPAPVNNPSNPNIPTQTFDLDIAVNPNNDHIYIVWQTGSLDTDQQPQIALSVSQDRGLSWSAPVIVNQTPQNIPNHQAFKPGIAVTEDNMVAIFYYDFRYDFVPDPNNLNTDAWLAVFEEVNDESVVGDPVDTTLVFRQEIRLTPQSFNMAANIVSDPDTLSGLNFGRFGGVEAAGEDVVVVFCRTNDIPQPPPPFIDYTPSLNPPSITIDNSPRVSVFYQKVKL